MNNNKELVIKITYPEEAENAIQHHLDEVELLCKNYNTYDSFIVQEDGSIKPIFGNINWYDIQKDA